MGFIRKIKNFFRKPIEIDNKNTNSVVSLSSQSGKVKINKNLEVPSGYVCFLVCKEKVCDKFTEGNYKLDLNNIPLTTRLLRLNIPNKKQEYKKYFKADIYFVSLKDFVDYKFRSLDGVYIKKDSEFLGFTADVKGNYSYRVKNPDLLLDALLKCYGLIKGNSAQRQIDIWTAFCVDRIIEKNKPNAYEIYERQSCCFEGLIDKLNKQMSDIGIEYTQVDVTETILPKKIYKRAQLSFEERKQNKTNVFDKQIEQNNNIKQKVEAINKEQQITLSPIENNLFNNEDKISSNIQENAFTNKRLEPLEINAISVENKNNQVEVENKLSENANEDKIEIENKIDLTSDIKDESNTENIKDSFDDKSVENSNLYSAENKPTLEEMQNKIAYKKCPKCGAYCPKDANTCFNCKTEFVKICEKCGAEIKNGDFVCPKCKSIVI